MADWSTWHQRQGDHFGRHHLPGQGRGSVRQHLDSHLAQNQLQLVQHPGPIEAHPLRTKTNAQNPHSIPIQCSEHVVLDVWFWLMAVYIYAAMTHQPLQTHMVRASKPVSAAPPAVAAALPPSSVYCFAEQPLSRGGLHGRLKHHLSSIAAYEGESLHSFRRGMAQHQAAAGQAHADIMRQMLLQTQQIFEATHIGMLPSPATSALPVRMSCLVSQLKLSGSPCIDALPDAVHAGLQISCLCRGLDIIHSKVESCIASVTA